MHFSKSYCLMGQVRKMKMRVIVRLKLLRMLQVHYSCKGSDIALCFLRYQWTLSCPLWQPPWQPVGPYQRPQRFGERGGWSCCTCSVPRGRGGPSQLRAAWRCGWQSHCWWGRGTPVPDGNPGSELQARRLSATEAHESWAPCTWWQTCLAPEPLSWPSEAPHRWTEALH